MNKLLFFILLVPVFAWGQQIPTVNDTVRIAGQGAVGTLAGSYGFDTHGNFISYIKRGTSTKYDFFPSGAYLRNYYASKASVQLTKDSLLNLFTAQSVGGDKTATGQWYFNNAVYLNAGVFFNSTTLGIPDYPFIASDYYEMVGYQKYSGGSIKMPLGGTKPYHILVANADGSSPYPSSTTISNIYAKRDSVNSIFATKADASSIRQAMVVPSTSFTSGVTYTNVALTGTAGTDYNIFDNSIGGIVLKPGVDYTAITNGFTLTNPVSSSGVTILGTLLNPATLASKNDISTFVPGINVIGKNLFNKLAVTAGFNWSVVNGSLVTAGTGSASEKIPVLPNTNYRTNTSVSLAYFDSSGSFISGSGSINTITTPANCYFIGMNVTAANINTVQLEQGTVITTYAAYTSTKMIPASLVNKLDSAVQFNPALVKTDVLSQGFYPSFLTPYNGGTRINNTYSAGDAIAVPNGSTVSGVIYYFFLNGWSALSNLKGQTVTFTAVLEYNGFAMPASATLRVITASSLTNIAGSGFTQIDATHRRYTVSRVIDGTELAISAYVSFAGFTAGSDYKLATQSLGYTVSGVTSSGITSTSTAVSDIVKSYIVNDKNPLPQQIRVKKNGTVGVDCEFNGNRGIQNAIEAITDASATKQYEIVVYPGVYSYRSTTDFNSQGSVTGNYAAIRGKNFVSIRGTKKEAVIISGFLPNNLGASFAYSGYQTVYWDNTFGKLSNLTITGQNLRYPVHTDNSTAMQGYVQNIENCDIIHYGNTGDALNWTSQTPIGLGVASGLKLTYKGLSLQSPFVAMYAHNNYPAFTTGSVTRFESCRMNNNTSATLGIFQSLGSGTDDVIEMVGNSWTGAYVIVANDNPWKPTGLNEQDINHCEIRIKGYGNSPFLYRPAFFGKALRIVSKSTGTSSTVRFDTTATAYPIIIKDKDYTATTPYTSYTGEVSTGGYAYRDGAVGIGGGAIGRLDIGDEGYGAALNVFGKSLGARLGDCSSVNKTLTVTVDGTTYNIVFNTNLTAASNATVVGLINAVIGSVATVDTWAVGNDYYPEVTDVNQIVSSNETTTILKGMALVLDANGQARRALSTDSYISGVAIDDILPLGRGRMITNSYISTINTDRFSILMDTYSTVAKGDKFGISASQPGYFSKTATTLFINATDTNVVQIVKL